MLKLQKSSLILILIIVVLTAGCVSIYTLSYTNGAVWHKAEDVKAGTFGSNVGNGNYNFPGNVGIKKTNPTLELDVTGNIYATDQVIAGTKFKVGSSELSSSSLKVNNDSLIVTETGNVGIGTTSPGAKLDVNGTIKISGGSPGEGKVLTSDANGIASWQNVSSAPIQGGLYGWGWAGGYETPTGCDAKEPVYCIGNDPYCREGYTLVMTGYASSGFGSTHVWNNYYSCMKN